jgi:general secretion pathway protein D
VLKKKNMNLFIKIPFAIMASLVMSGCAHQSKVVPSTGHIEAKTATQQVKQTTAAPIPKPVRSSPVLPPPKATRKALTYSVVVNEVPVKEILFALARESKLNIDIHPAIQGRATLNAVEQTLPAILERLARQVDLTYKMENNVLYITPDQPELRFYKIDYVNINRDTVSSIGVDGQISGVVDEGQSGGNDKNHSSTTVDSVSKHHLWESLIQNLKELLAETDKEVIVKRFGSLGERDNEDAGLDADELEAQAELSKAEAQQRDEQRTEYKTLFAANVIANAETGVISVRATSKQHEKVQEFIDRVMNSAKKQVLIEATIVEVQLSDSFQAGIDWSRLNNGANNSGFVFGQTLGSKGVGFNPNVIFNPNTNAGTADQFITGDSNALNIAQKAGFVAGYLNPASAIGNIAASITLLKQFGDTKVLSSPKLMVLNNQTAVLKVVDNLVYFTVKADQGFATGGGVITPPVITTTPHTVPVGIVMSVTPQINNADNVNINVRPTISSVIGFEQDPNPALTIVSRIPIIQVREMESVLQVNSGNTAVLGGLMQDFIAKNTDKVPGLSDIPGVGKVFTGKNDANRKTELVIFLRPTVIRNASLESDELSSFKQYLPAQQLQKALEEAN